MLSTTAAKTRFGNNTKPKNHQRPADITVNAVLRFSTRISFKTRDSIHKRFCRFVDVRNVFAWGKYRNGVCVLPNVICTLRIRVCRGLRQSVTRANNSPQLPSLTTERRATATARGFTNNSNNGRPKDGVGRCARDRTYVSRSTRIYIRVYDTRSPKIVSNYYWLVTKCNLYNSQTCRARNLFILRRRRRDVLRPQRQLYVVVIIIVCDLRVCVLLMGV